MNTDRATTFLRVSKSSLSFAGRIKITTESNDLLRPIHDRMPVIMAKEREAAWIDPDNHHQKALLSLLKPYPAVEMDRADVTDFMHSGVNHAG